MGESFFILMEVSIFQSYQQEASHVLVFCQTFPSFPASSPKKYPTVKQGLLSQKDDKQHRNLHSKSSKGKLTSFKQSVKHHYTRWPEALLLEALSVFDLAQGLVEAWHFLPRRGHFHTPNRIHGQGIFSYIYQEHFQLKSCRL